MFLSEHVPRPGLRVFRRSAVDRSLGMLVLLVDLLERQDHIDVVESLNGWQRWLFLHLLDFDARQIVFSISISIVNVELTVGNVSSCFNTMILEVLRCGFLLQDLRFERLGGHHALGAGLGGVVEVGGGGSHRRAPSWWQRAVIAFGCQLFRVIFPRRQRALERMRVRFLVDVKRRLQHLVLATALTPGVDGESIVLALLEWFTRCRCRNSSSIGLNTVLSGAFTMLGARADQLNIIQSFPERLLQGSLVHGSLLSFGFYFFRIK